MTFSKDIPVLSYGAVQTLREKDKNTINPLRIIAQAGAQERVLSQYADIIISGGSRGGPLQVDTRVVTPFGYRRIGDLKAGDIISSTDGGQQRVVYRQDHGKLPCYKLTFIDGSSVIASTDHLWNVRRDEGKFQVWTTQMIVDNLGNQRLYIPICKPIQFEKNNSDTDDCFVPIAERYPILRNYGIEPNCELTQVPVCDKDVEKIKFLADSLGKLTYITSKFHPTKTTITIISNITGRRIVKAEYVGKKECCCIAVNNANSLFMVEDFIVTHNSKSWSLVMEGLKDIKEPTFSGLIVRNERDDLTQIIDYSLQMYQQYGTFNRSKDDRTWNFYAGGKLRFSYYNDAFDDFKKRFQGKQFNYIGIDEITHIPYEKFKYLATCNRNGMGLRNRIWGTCNPDPDSWVRKFIDWWIGPDGFPIKERDCKIRYCFMDGDSPDTIFWGNTEEEVYEQCKDIIEPLWNEKYAEMGYDKKRMFVKSVTFVRAGLEDNVKLMLSDPSYLANLAQQSDEQRSRDLEGNWNFKAAGEDMIKLLDMERFFDRPKIEGGIRRASVDVAFEGGDSLVMWLWEGMHIKDLYVCRYDSKNSVNAVKAKLQEWSVLEENMVYDLNGVGQTFRGFFPHARPFNNIAGVEPKFKGMYHDLKSQCAYIFAHKLMDGEISIEPRLLNMRFSGKGFSNVPLRQILLKERRAIRAEDDSSDKGFTLIKKKAMRALVGHSPDYIEALLMRMLFEVGRGGHTKTVGIPKYRKALSIRFL